MFSKSVTKIRLIFLIFKFSNKILLLKIIENYFEKLYKINFNIFLSYMHSNMIIFIFKYKKKVSTEVFMNQTHVK